MELEPVEENSEHGDAFEEGSIRFRNTGPVTFDISSEAGSSAKLEGLEDLIRAPSKEVTLFPFLAFRHLHLRPYYSKDGQTDSIASWVFRNIAPVDAETGKYPPLFRKAVQFGALLVGSMVAIFFIVYICFSFDGDSTFPSINTTALYWWLLGRNFFLIVLMHTLCSRLCVPNRDRLRMLHFDLDKVEPALAYIGVYHTLRRWLRRVTGREFHLRWYTTYLSDSILLAITYFFYVVYAVMVSVTSESPGRVLVEVTNIYRSLLTLGFVVYTLEFAPRVAPRKQGMFVGILLFNMAMNLADFFLFVGDKPYQSAIVRAFGAGAQLFITHSCVLMAAVIGGHHMHAHVSPDLPWSGLLKLFLTHFVGALWLTYCVYKEQFGYGDHGIHNHNWVPVSYAYVLWALNVVGGLACIGFTVKYCYGRSRSLQLLRLSSTGATMVNKGASGKEAEEEEAKEGMDFDILLIVITFVVAAVYYSSEVYGNFSLGQYTTMAYWVTAPIAPIGLSVLAAAFWWRPPAAAKIGLYVALALAQCWLCSLEVAEDCHLNSTEPECCYYPWLPDSNHHFETPHPAPVCAGFSLDSGDCVTTAVSAEGQEIITLSFTQVTDVTRAVQIDAYLDSAHIFSEYTEDIPDLVQTTTCRDEENSFHVNGTEFVLEPGCFGKYVFEVPEETSALCTEGNNSCVFTVSTLNCAFVPSEPLTFVNVDLSEGAEALNLNLNPNVEQESDRVQSTFYSFFTVVGMAALLECFFTLFGVVLKLVFLSECRTETVAKLYTKRSTVLFDLTAEGRPRHKRIAAHEQADGDRASLSGSMRIDQ